MLKKSNLRKYLRCYAEPESLVATPPTEHYQAAVVVPACGETHYFLDLWNECVEAATGLRLLVVLVINADGRTPKPYTRANSRLVADVLLRPNVRLQSSTPSYLVTYNAFDVLLLDRTEAPHLLPDKCGVGLARKIGADVVCAWHERGVIESPWWLSTDADAALPAGIARQLCSLPKEAGIVCFPFEHIPGDDERVNAATWAVEVELRYHALGLAYAGSNYAWPALGSCLALHTDTYASIRGFPKRQAGEDHYVLQKASKLAPVWYGSGEPVRILARKSARTPFGTGRSVEQLLARELRLDLRHPECYSWLRQVIIELNALGAHASWAQFDAWCTRAVPSSVPIASVLSSIGAFDAWQHTCELKLDAHVRRRRLHEWFDGLRQIQFLRGLEGALPKLPADEALQSAPFTPGVIQESEPAAARNPWFTWANRLRQLSLIPVPAPWSIRDLTPPSV